MNALYLLVVLSGAPGPTWFVSEPTTQAVCEAKKAAVVKISDDSKGGFGLRLYSKPYVIECVKIEASE
jgi:hypothetical protein